MGMVGSSDGRSGSGCSYKCTARDRTIRSSSGFTQKEVEDHATSCGIREFVALDADSGRALNPDDFRAGSSCNKYCGNVVIRETCNTK